MGLRACTGDVASSVPRSLRLPRTVAGTAVDVAGTHRACVDVPVTRVDGDRWRVAS